MDAARADLNRTLRAAVLQNDGGGGGSGGGGGEEGPLRHERHAAGSLLSAVDRHASSFGSKVTNMYTELWRRTQVLEALSKDAMALSNATRRELQEGLRSVAMQLGRYCSLQADKAKPNPQTIETFEGTLAEMSHKMAYYFQTIISTQNVFLESCHRIQDGEDVLEKYITQLLERMVDLISSNKCQNEVEEVHELLKSHHSTVVRNVGHNTNTVMRAADNSSKETKNLASVINEVQEGLLATAKDIQKSVTSMHDGQINVHQVLGKIATAMAEFQNNLSDLANNTSTKENPAYSNTCSDSKTFASDIVTEMQKLFKEIQKHNSAEIQNLTQTVISMLNNEALQNGMKKMKKREGYRSDGDNQTEAPLAVKNFTEENHIQREINQHVHRETESQLEISTNQYQDNVISNLDSTSAELTIKIIPNIHHLEDSKKHSETLESSLSTDMDTDTTHRSDDKQNEVQTETLVTIVHNDKPITAEGQVIYSSDSQHINRNKNVANQNDTSKEPQDISLIKQDLDDKNSHNASNSTQIKTPTVYQNVTQNSNNITTTQEPVETTVLPEIMPKNDSLITALRNEQHSTLSQLSEHYSESEIQEILKKLSDAHNRELEMNITFHAGKNNNIGNSSKNVSYRNISSISSHIDEHTVYNKTHTTTQNSTSAEAESENRNITDQSLYQLLNRLEELTNRLMNSGSEEESVSLNTQPEDSEEDSDYKIPDSNISAN